MQIGSAAATTALAPLQGEALQNATLNFSCHAARLRLQAGSPLLQPSINYL